MWLELSKDEKKSIKMQKQKYLNEWGQYSLFRWTIFRHHRQLLPSESLSEFVHNLKRLLHQAMPEADAATRKQLLIHQFLTGIPVEVSKQLRAAGEIDDLGRLIQRTKLLMTLDCSEKTAAVGK